MQIEIVATRVLVLPDQQLRVDLGQDVLRPENERGQVFTRQDVHVGLQELFVS